jgi:hypothetical protein
MKVHFMLTPLRAFLLAMSAVILAPIPSQAAGGYWEFGSWRVFVDEVDTGEDLRRTCTAMTGGDGDMSAVLSVSNGDAGPPYYFPELIINDNAIRHHTTVLKQDAPVYVWFDDEDVYDGAITQYVDVDGFQHAELRFPQTISQWLLLAMKRNSQMDVVMNGRATHSFFLDGFTASYLKMMDECGFTGAGVLDQK